MNLFFTAVTNKLHHKTLVELVNSTPKIEKIFLIYHGDFEFIFNSINQQRTIDRGVFIKQDLPNTY